MSIGTIYAILLVSSYPRRPIRATLPIGWLFHLVLLDFYHIVNIYFCMDRIVYIIDAYERGIPLSKIGKSIEISRQRVWQIIRKHMAGFNVDTSNRRTVRRRQDHCNPSENFLIKSAEKRGLLVERMPYGYLFDLKINGHSVEIKHRINPSNMGAYSYYKFGEINKTSGAELCVLMCGPLSKCRCYIFPMKYATSSISIPHRFIYPKAARKWKSRLNDFSLFKST